MLRAATLARSSATEPVLRVPAPAVAAPDPRLDARPELGRLREAARTLSARPPVAAPVQRSGVPVVQLVTVDVRRSQKLVKDVGEGKLGGTTFSWDSRFDVDVVSDKIVVTIRIKSNIDPKQFETVWAKQVEKQWSNRFMVQHAGENYPIIVQLVQVEKGEHYTVTPSHSESALSSGSRGHFGTENMTTWGVHDTTNISHEVGHMLGNPDEYGIVESGGKTTDYIKTPSTSIMGRSENNPVAEHYELIRQAAEQELNKKQSTPKQAVVLPDVGGRLKVEGASFNPHDVLGVKLSKVSAPLKSKESQEEPSELSSAFAKFKSKSSAQQGLESVSHGSRDPAREKMEGDLREARAKAKRHADSWVVARLVTYIERTIEQYDRGESQSWCVKATAGFLKDIDQAIAEKEEEGPWPSFMSEK